MMIVLHVGMLEQRLLLWGETPSAPSVSGKRGRAARSAVQPSPFNAGAEALVTALQQGVADLPDGRKLKPADCRNAVIWLPTADGVPAASSPLIAPATENAREATLAPHEVTALPLTAEQAVALLTACVGRDTLAPGILLGSTLLYWTKALRYAGALLVRQQIVPDVAQIGTTYRGRWQPVFAGKESETLLKLAQAMPSACRAFGADAFHPPQTPAVSVLTEFLGIMCDHLVRSAALQDDELTIRRARKTAPKEFDSLHAQWLHALRAADGTLTGSAAELAAFAAQVREWQRP